MSCFLHSNEVEISIMKWIEQEKQKFLIHEMPDFSKYPRCCFAGRTGQDSKVKQGVDAQIISTLHMSGERLFRSSLLRFCCVILCGFVWSQVYDREMCSFCL